MKQYSDMFSTTFGTKAFVVSYSTDGLSSFVKSYIKFLKTGKPTRTPIHGNIDHMSNSEEHYRVGKKDVIVICESFNDTFIYTIERRG